MLVLLLALGLVQGPATPPGRDGVAEYRALAAWAGSWEVVNAADGRVTQTGERSDDAGKTWSWDFQLTFVRKTS